MLEDGILQSRDASLTSSPGEWVSLLRLQIRPLVDRSCYERLVSDLLRVS